MPLPVSQLTQICSHLYSRDIEAVCSWLLWQKEQTPAKQALLYFKLLYLWADGRNVKCLVTFYVLCIHHISAENMENILSLSRQSQAKPAALIHSLKHVIFSAPSHSHAIMEVLECNIKISYCHGHFTLSLTFRWVPLSLALLDCQFSSAAHEPVRCIGNATLSLPLSPLSSSPVASLLP